MKKVIQRLLVFFIGVPAVFILVYLLPFYNHLPLNIVIILFCGLGAVEFSAMLKKKQLSVSKAWAFILGILAPLSAALTVNFILPQWIVPLIILSGPVCALIYIAFWNAEKMEAVICHLAGVFSLLVYPGFFMSWLVKMTSMNNSGLLILVFLFIVFGSDSAAWLTGTLFGKNNRGKIAASPNKSIAGFIGGGAGSVIVSCGAALLVPGIFVSRFEFIPVIPAAILLGIFTGIASALGDLAESAIKRSCDVKDSGRLMLGRGGILDSIDSIAFASPVFFLFFNLLFLNSR
jgi:phosphatidate cytidylyltransferase